MQVAGLTLYEAPDLLEVLLVGKPAQRVHASCINPELMLHGGLLQHAKWKLSYYMRTQVGVLGVSVVL